MTTQLQRDDVIAAQKTLTKDLLSTVTPLLRSQLLSELLGGDVFLKCENVQRTGSFKARGAYWRIHQLSHEQRAQGVVAASAGNHAQGVALAARKLGTSATVVMPKTAPLPKVSATERYLGPDQELVLHGETVPEAIAHAKNLAAERGSVFIHPYDHEDVIAGQGTVGLEIAEQCPEVKTVVVPVGGGGLAAGIAVALADHRPSPRRRWGRRLRGSAPRVVGVQAAACAAYPDSLRKGSPVSIECGFTIADGIAVPTPGEIPLGILLEHQVPVLTVSEDTLYRALLMCLERAKQLVEPAGVAAFGALLEHKDKFKSKFESPVVVVLSGGNIDPLLLGDLLRHGLSAAGRVLEFKCRLADKPGSVAKLLKTAGDVGANLVDMNPRRVAQLQLHEAEVAVHLETKGEKHRKEVIEHLIKQLEGKDYTLDFS
ncbi:pyridoxal-phosphate dependent enzyme [Streptomyces sp. NBC_00624]|uniref:threonine ammonia-lyase n=1 Tax=Streptomyces sp. NBC_00624 TaxID=2975791 RepID=UPI002F91076A